MPRPLIKRKSKKLFRLTPERAQMIAKAIIRQDKPLKQIASEFGCSYALAWKIMREYVNVEKTMTLRYPDLDAQEPADEHLYRGLLPYREEN